MGYELEKAKMEADRNAAVDAYFKARPWLDSADSRNIFEAGFERAWSLRQKEIDELKHVTALLVRRCEDELADPEDVVELLNARAACKE
jgi:hypothetical protein